jgi:uncharacterized OB-fold protein
MNMGSVAQQIVREKKLLGSKCERCQYVSYPAMGVCPKCGPRYAEQVKPTELPTMGAVVTWAKLQVAPKGFPSPLLHCVLDLGNVKLLGTVQGTEEIRIGEKMVITEDPSGRFPFVFSRPTS